MKVGVEYHSHPEEDPIWESQGKVNQVSHSREAKEIVIVLTIVLAIVRKAGRGNP